MFTLRRTAIAKLSSAISSHSLRLPTSCLPLNRSTMPSSKSSTYQHQGSLPNVPVPELEATATKYFQSTQEPNSPTASDNTSTPAYKHTKACVEDFLRSPLVKELQIITLLIRSIIIASKRNVCIFPSFDSLHKSRWSTVHVHVDIPSSLLIKPRSSILKSILICLSSGRAIKPDGSFSSEAELKSQFQKIIQLAGSTEAPFPVGALTTEHRDIWADVSNALPECEKNCAKLIHTTRNPLRELSQALSVLL
ncbi:hypothetical protein VP01_936g2 [Puccinia sorghi]|uniref:Choline/carnitine acyltransferase domain-containing protein n=1 Tax=Puccinia sorghi TaxID=27349 RepID=A0A0L6U7B6_9BASI|nr:hypothetical protein VP01_936g2 [Puccinia sorghi]